MSAAVGQAPPRPALLRRQSRPSRPSRPGRQSRPGRPRRPSPPGQRAATSERQRTRAVLLAVSAAVVAVRLVYVTQPLRSDEGGYLMVARAWQAGAGEFLYGDYHVDRPPLLLGIYRVAALWEWDGAIRVLAIPFVLLAVLALARAGFLVAGHRGARWSGVAAGAMLCSPALAADQADGELFAVAFVAGALAMTLQAWRASTRRGQLLAAAAAGVLAGAAPLVKQNFLEGLVFAAVLVVADVVLRRRLDARAVRVAGAFGVGCVAALAASYGWVLAAGLDPLRLWNDVVSFRGQALSVIWSGRLEAPMLRAVALVGLALLSMVVPIAWTWSRWMLGRRRAAAPEEWGVAAMLAYGLWAMVVGGSYWPHYLLQLVAAAALGAGMVAGAEGRRAWTMRRHVRIAVGSALVGAVGLVVVYATVPHVWYQERTGAWLAASADPGDTAYLAYGQPSVLEAADLASPYPYLWSLPMRTLDPEQDRLRATLAGPDAPAWVIRLNPLDSWGIDDGERLRGLISARYDEVAHVCGHAVLLRSDLDRELAPPPRC